MPDERKRLLVLEDHVDSMELLVTVLGQKYAVTGCSSCKSALEAAQTLRPDALLFDIALPDVDGVECLRRIRKIDGLANVPAIALTAYAFSAERERFTAAGFQRVVTKPIVDFAGLVLIVDDIIKG